MISIPAWFPPPAPAKINFSDVKCPYSVQYGHFLHLFDLTKILLDKLALSA